ncbi:uncharacterized protein LOC122013865 [Zingiber officinale]|uniref:uncharacterized protein LOC122013865 n=1 Tax=Zingiber officinale TaxID=94328 RepID=UPI001C4B8D81|nr:uncharacterized protein LOC122013865 [Zingiber officinale]
MSHFICNYDCLLSSDDELETIVTAFLIEDSLDDEEGSRSQIIPGKQRRVFIRRNPLEGHIRLFNDYFADPSIYPPNIFRRRFQMNRDIFLRILNNVENHESYFVQRRNAVGTLGLSSLQKVTAALRILAYGVGADLMDEYVRIGETTVIKSMKLFAKAVISIFGDEYLQSPNNNGIARLLAVGEKRGFPGRKRQLFASAQESTRKDVERAFGVLQARFAIVRGPARYFCQSELKDIMMACIILHNMIVEDERNSYLRAHDFDYD